MNNNKFSGRAVLFILAGCYLLYLVYGLAKDIMSGEVPESRIVLIAVVTVIFAVCGVILLIVGIRGYREQSSSDSQEEDEEQ